MFSEDVRQYEPSLCEEKSERVELGGGEEHEVRVDLPTNLLKSGPSTGVRSSLSRASPSLEETSSVSGKMTTLRWARLLFTGKSDGLRSVRRGVSEADESGTPSSGRVSNAGVA